MELLPEDGSAPPIPVSSALFLGRGSAGACSVSDLTVSRRHLSLSPADSGGGGDRRWLQFEVVGRNPVVVVDGGFGEEKRRIVRPSEKGELKAGDRVSLSLKNPRFLRVEAAEEAEGAGVEKGVLDAVRRREERTEKRRKMAVAADEARKEEDEVRRSGEEDGRVGEDVWVSSGGPEEGPSATELDFGFEPLDTSQIDAVKEFGFLVRGHELDMYPRKKVRAVKDWDWFLEDDRAGGESEDDDDETPTRQRKSRKRASGRRRNASGEDEEWTGESEEDKEVVAKGGVVSSGTSTKRTKYATRSSDPKRSKKGSSRVKKARGGPAADDDVFRDADEDEEDETLGGFIVDDEEEELEEEDEEEDEEEEEEFEEDEEDE